MSEAPRTPPRGDWLFAAALFVAAYAIRQALASRFAAEPVWDGHYYEYYAKRIALGFGYSDGPFDPAVPGHPACHYPVGYSAVLGLVYRVFGAKLAVARAFDALVSATVPVLTWRLAQLGDLSTARARIAGVVTALHPGLCLYAALVMSEPLSSALTLASFVTLLELRARRPRLAIPAAAVVLGLATLVRPQALLCAPLLVDLRPALGEGALGPRLRRAIPGLLRDGVMILAFCMLPVLPWTARNCRQMDGCAIVSTNGGWNLAIGAFPRATGRFESLHGSDGCKVVTGQVQQDRCWGRYGVRQIVDDPRRWLGLAPAKLGFTFDHESFQVEYLHEARPQDFPEDVRSAARERLTLFHRLLLVAAALGGVARLRRPLSGGAVAQGALLLAIVALAAWGFAQGSPVLWPLAVVAAVVPFLPVPMAPTRPFAVTAAAFFLATVCVTHVLFFGEDRYHVVASPALCLLAAAAFRRPRLPLPAPLA